MDFPFASSSSVDSRKIFFASLFSFFFFFVSSSSIQCASKRERREKSRLTFSLLKYSRPIFGGRNIYVEYMREHNINSPTHWYVDIVKLSKFMLQRVECYDVECSTTTLTDILCHLYRDHPYIQVDIIPLFVRLCSADCCELHIWFSDFSLRMCSNVFTGIFASSSSFGIFNVLIQNVMFTFGEAEWTKAAWKWRAITTKKIFFSPRSHDQQQSCAMTSIFGRKKQQNCLLLYGYGRSVELFRI